MAPRKLVFYNYYALLWNGALRVKLDNFEVGDVLILGGCKGCYPDVEEVRVMAVNVNETLTVIKRDDGGVENVKLRDLWRPDFLRLPRMFRSGRPRTIPCYQRPLCKDEILKHGVELAR